MGSVRMFRDRVVSMEQTQEIGEKHVDLLSALVTEALPGFAVAAHGLEHESDHYWLSVANVETGATCRVVFTRMFLSDASRLPAVVADAKAGVREQIVACIREQTGLAEILVSVARLLTDEERAESEEIESEWRKKHEAALAARRAEDERRARERQRQKQQEEARRHAQRERERRERASLGGGSPQAAAAQPGEGGSRRRRRRGRGGASGRPASQPGGNAGGGRTQQPRAASAAGPAAGPRAQIPPHPALPVGAASPEGARAEGGGGRRRRRRGRGRGGPSGSAGPKPGGAAPSGGTSQA